MMPMSSILLLGLLISSVASVVWLRLVSVSTIASVAVTVTLLSVTQQLSWKNIQLKCNLTNDKPYELYWKIILALSNLLGRCAGALNKVILKVNKITKQHALENSQSNTRQ